MTTCAVPPVITCAVPPVIQKRSHKAYWVSAVLAVVLVLGLVSVTGCFRLRSETATLRESCMASLPGRWDTRINLRLGGLTTLLVRTGSRFFKLDPEPRAVLDAVHGVDVGVYALQELPDAANSATILASTDKAMARRGWERVVGVMKERDLVAVYLPRSGLSTRHVSCALFVLHGPDLVVASARGNLEPLLEIARHHGFPEATPFLASR